MEIQELFNLVSNVGFPFACVIVMGKYIMHIIDENNKNFKQINSMTLGQIDDLKEVIERNTDCIQEIINNIKYNGGM